MFVMKVVALPALIISVRFQIKNIEESIHECLEDTMMLMFGTEEEEDFCASVKRMNKDGYSENLGKRRRIHTF